MESSTAITVQWGPVEPCDQQNGVITGYSVRYGEVGTSEGERRVEIASGTSSSIVSGLTKETVYTVEVAAQTSGGTGVYSEPLTIETPDSECAFWLWHSSLLVLFTSSTDVYLSLNGEVIPNHGYVEIIDIGYSYRTALLCHTNRPAITSYSYFVGKWLTPERDRVEYSTLGFRSSYDSMPVRLWRNRYGSADVGIFWCETNDATETLQRVHVGLYNSGEGIAGFSVIHINVHFYFTKLSQVRFHYQLLFQPLTSMEIVLSLPSPVSPLVDLLPLSPGPETQSLSLKELRLC